jgi:hypothetical protein
VPEVKPAPRPKVRNRRPKKNSPSRRSTDKWRLRIYYPDRPKQSGGANRKRKPK